MVAVEILQKLYENPRLTPSMLAKKTGFKQQYVKNTLRVLSELKLVDTVDRGVYILTPIGEKHLDTLQSKEVSTEVK